MPGRAAVPRGRTGLLVRAVRRNLAGVTRRGSTRGTVVRWDEDRGGGVVEAPGLPGACWVPAAVVLEEAALRAGQVVDVDWTEPGAEGFPCRATRAVRRDDQQATPGA